MPSEAKTWGKRIIRTPNLSTAGFAATTISFGPARMGFGLFAPEFRSAFSLSTSAVGLVSSIGFTGFLFGLFLTQALLARRGPQAPVLIGLMAATAGMALVAAAPNTAILAIGVFVAGSSAGFTWTPFNDAVHVNVSQPQRPGALSKISTGTSVGVAAAASAAYLVSLYGLSWRSCWTLFAIAGGLALLFNHSAWSNAARKAGASLVDRSWKEFLATPAISLFVVAFVMGTVSAIYIAFAADRMTRAGGVPGVPLGRTAALVFMVYGVCGLAGLLAGRLRKAIGLSPLLRATMLAGAASLALLGLVPGTWTGLVLSAGLQGLHVMMTSAIMAFWSERLYPDQPAFGFNVTLLVMAAGCVIGPYTAGLASDAFGAGPTFLGSAALAVAPVVLLRRRHLFRRGADPCGRPGR